LSSSPDGSEVLVQTRRFSTAEEGSTVAVRLKSASFGASTFHGFRVHRRAHISDVQPRDGPCKGGTRITISGDNLRQDGDAYSEMSVLVAGTRARVVGLTKKYVIAETALCPSGATNGRVFSCHVPSDVWPLRIRSSIVTMLCPRSPSWHQK
jgi:hypothetical protein